MEPAPVPVLLASASPRRRRLLHLLGAAFDVTSVEVDETIPDPLPSGIAEFASALAGRKAVAARLLDPDGLVLAFDTLVFHDEILLGKPRDEVEAASMLRSLSGRRHSVVTGVAVAPPGTLEPLSLAVVTPVEMRVLSDADVERWVEQGECMGCAGAYNIESHLATVSLDECFQNVAGLPLCHLHRVLRAFPEEIAPAGLRTPVPACDRLRRVSCRLGPRLAPPAGADGAALD
jgi:septum formation protein